MGALEATCAYFLIKNDAPASSALHPEVPCNGNPSKYRVAVLTATLHFEEFPLQGKASGCKAGPDWGLAFSVRAASVELAGRSAQQDTHLEKWLWEGTPMAPSPLCHSLQMDLQA